MPEWPLRKAAWEMWVTDESSPRGAGERPEPERMEDEWAVSTEESGRRQLFWEGVWKGKGIGKNTRSGEMFATLYVNQESWENKQHGEGAEAGEWETLRASHAGWRRGDGWTGSTACGRPLRSSPLAEMRAFSRRASTSCGIVIALVFIAHFPWVIQITGNMLSHLYIWHLYKRRKILTFHLRTLKSKVVKGLLNWTKI